VERGGATIWGGSALLDAMGRGYSIDSAESARRDRVLVPARSDFGKTAGIIGALMAIRSPFTHTKIH